MNLVKYVGDYYKIMFEPGGIYELLEITGDGFYRVYLEAVEDWALCSPNDFELVEPLQREER